MLAQKERKRSESELDLAAGQIVSFAAVFRLVTQRSSLPGEERCVTSLKTAAKETTGQIYLR